MSGGYSLSIVEKGCEIFHSNLSYKILINHKHLIVNNSQIRNSGTIVLLTEIYGLHRLRERPVEIDDTIRVNVVGEHKN